MEKRFFNMWLLFALLSESPKFARKFTLKIMNDDRSLDRQILQVNL